MQNFSMQQWVIGYLVGAILVGCAALACGERLRGEDPVGQRGRDRFAMIAGALWPVLLLGIGQLLLVQFVAKRLRAPTGSASEREVPADFGVGARVRADRD